MPPRAHASEGGFTLVELIVAGMLGAIIFAMMVGVVMGAFSGSNDVSETQRLREQFDHAQEMLSQDLRSARAPQRDFDLIRDRTEFQRWMQRREGGLVDAGYDMSDVKYATPTELRFVADVLSVPANAAECVAWRLTTGTQGTHRTWSFERGVGPYSATCDPAGGGWQWATWIGPMRVGDGSTAQVPTEAFGGYNITCHPTNCTGGAGGHRCDPPVARASVTNARELDWITTVDLDFGSASARREGTAKDKLNATIALRNRLSDDYRYALGCLEDS